MAPRKNHYGSNVIHLYRHFHYGRFRPKPDSMLLYTITIIPTFTNFTIGLIITVTLKTSPDEHTVIDVIHWTSCFVNMHICHIGMGYS